LRRDILNTDHIMALVQRQYDQLVESGAYEREHEAWPDYTVDPAQLDYLRWWLDARFAWLDRELGADCGSWSVSELVEDPSDPEPVEGPEPSVQVFPNPSHGRLNVRLSAPEPVEGQVAEPVEASVRLYDMTGRLVYSDASVTQAFVISTQGLTQGIYNLVVNMDGRQLVKRVVVE